MALVILKCNVPITKFSVTGVYVFLNKERMPPSPEAPLKSDTLVLKADKTFLSGFYGEGTYSFTGSQIKLNYNDKFGKGIYIANFSNRLFENKKIILNYDLNQYYEKVE